MQKLTKIDGVLGSLLGGMIIILVFTALAPVVANNVAGADTANFTNGSDSLFGLTTLFFVLVGIVAIIALVRFRKGGL